MNMFSFFASAFIWPALVNRSLKLAAKPRPLSSMTFFAADSAIRKYFSAAAASLTPSIPYPNLFHEPA